MLPFALLALLGAGPTPSVAEVEAFKAHFQKGEELFQQAEFGAAIWNFREADRLRQTPEVAFDLAKCHEKLGELPMATYYYRLYLRRAPTAQDAMDVAGKVGAALGEAEGEGKGYVELESSSGAPPILDGRTHVEFPLALFLSAGDHELASAFPGGVKKHRFVVKAGKLTTVHLEPLPPPLVDSASGDALFAALPGEAPKGSSSGALKKGLRYGSWAVLGASVLAAAAGTAFGVMASADQSRLSSPAERSGLTVAQARQLAGQANANGSSANLLWLAGGAGALVGGVALGVSFVLPEPGQGSAKR